MIQTFKKSKEAPIRQFMQQVHAQAGVSDLTPKLKLKFEDMEGSN